jgi:murein DD-endopeptidase MepM/ murein hydrolase activator NlpD
LGSGVGHADNVDIVAGVATDAGARSDGARLECKVVLVRALGASGVHKGIDVFARKGTPLVAPTYGIVVFRSNLKLGGKVIAILGPKLRIHYFAHLDSMDVYPGYPVWNGRRIGTVGDTGNAQGKPAHLHYSAITLLPYPWRIDSSTQGWRKMFYLDPVNVLRLQ